MNLTDAKTPPPGISVLITSLNYAPEQTGIAPYSTKLAEGLHMRGMDVTVLAGYPHYPQWTLHAGYKRMTMKEKVNDVKIKRLRHHIPAVPKFLPRLHLELSYGLRAMLTRWHKPDVTLAVSPALFATGMSVLKARVTGAPIGIWVQDLYSRGLEETHGDSSMAARLMKTVEGNILRSATGVTVIHERFRHYVINELGVPEEKVRVIRNWTHVEVPEHVDRQAVRARLGWHPDEVIALHAGNMGVKQDLGNVVEAAIAASDNHSTVRFVLLGDGNQRPFLEKLAKNVANITIMSPLPDSDFIAALQSADVLIVNELPGVKEMSVPSKLTSYFATGQPIVAATEPDSATADEIRASGSGLHVNSGDPTALLAAVEKLADDQDLAAACSRAGIPYAQTVLNEDRAISEFATWLKSLTYA